MQNPSGNPCSRRQRATESLPTPDGPESTNTSPDAAPAAPGSMSTQVLPAAAGHSGTGGRGVRGEHGRLAPPPRGVAMAFDALTLHSVRDELVQRLVQGYVERVVQSGASE